ncbi:uncharacterized protein LOC107478630 [Arachis duranensis]|uniref:Uncharacterized protein LOC107478630 n=1 Tax=Arachis duranensis TaxID=130453 RepID=A0A6P4CPJ1_ARADU|nr:uncharacterized protein LOC107478630 [Arachis duranensis]
MEAVIRAMKDYTIRRGVDYRVYESEPLTFYAKCTQYGSGCDWLIMVSLMSRKYCWVIRRYNGSHTCTRATISQDHSKLDSNTIAEAIKPLVEADPSIMVKSIIAEVQSKFNYTVSYRKAWLAKQKSVKKYLQVGKHRTKLCLYGLRPCVIRSHQQLSILRLCLPIKAMTWLRISGYCIESFGVITPCIRAFRHCKPVVQVDGTHLYGKYKGCPLVAVLQDGNNNIIPIAFGIVEGETFDAWYFILSNLRQHVMTRDGVGLISDQHESINATVAHSNGAWSPPRAFHIFCIRHIESNFLRKFKGCPLVAVSQDENNNIVPIAFGIVEGETSDAWYFILSNLRQHVVTQDGVGLIFDRHESINAAVARSNGGYSKTIREYELHYQRLQERGEAYTTWLNRISRELYALAFDSGY